MISSANSPDRVAEIAGLLTKAQRAMVSAQHSPTGNPWPFISITERSGGAKARTFDRMKGAGIYDCRSQLTPLGLALRAHLMGEKHD